MKRKKQKDFRGYSKKELLDVFLEEIEKVDKNTHYRAMHFEYSICDIIKIHLYSLLYELKIINDDNKSGRLTKLKGEMK